MESETIHNKLGVMTELDLFLFKDRKPSLAEQLYETVLQSDIYADILAEIARDEAESAPAADMENEGYSQIGNISIAELLKGSSITPDEVDAILRDGGNYDNHKLHDCPSNGRSALRIAAYFTKGLDDNARYLRREYLTGRYGRDATESGKGFKFAGRNICAWFDNDGISLAAGVTAKNNLHRVTIPWEAAAARIDELMRAGQYISRPAFDSALDNERRELAGKLWSFYRDDMEEIPADFKAERGGYPDDAELICSLLENDSERSRIRDRLEADVTAWENNPGRRSWGNPARVLEEMNNAMHPPVILPDDSFSYEKPFAYFITQDEIDAVITRGGTFIEGKARFFSFSLGSVLYKIEMSQK